METNWYDSTVFYQIYMPSFCDGNGDGIGDFKGITSKLDYLHKLGIGGIWLTPFYPSPKIDNGYDICDYYGIDPDFGTMEDFELFLKEAKKRNIHVICDIVINHTSSSHPWFIEAKSSRNNPKRNWYIWKKSKDNTPPNNWESFFGGSAWEFDQNTQEYYYHSFSKEQVDLNWGNPEVKQEIFKMLDFWLEKGISGFRFDVINNLTIQNEWKDNPIDQNGKQNHLYDINQKGIHTLLKELRAHITKKKNIFLVGEISSEQLDLIHSYVSPEELDTTFNFNLGSKKQFDLSEIYQELKNIQQLYIKEKPSLFFGSHDLNRFPSRFEFSEQEIKVLLTFLLTFRGIPFLYFGDEIGMEGLTLNKISEARDIQGILAYERALLNEKKENALQILNRESRDKSRNIMQWNKTSYYGFSIQKPWLYTENNQAGKTVEEQEKEENSILNYTKRVIALRKTSKTLSNGTCTLLPLQNGLLSYTRKYNGENIVVLLNFSNKKINFNSFGIYIKQIILSSENIQEKTEIMPYSALIGILDRLQILNTK